MSQALGSQDKTEVVIEGANHYYFGQPEKLAEAVAACASWLKAKGFD
jgi:alpha/beta superfamily hydrolase